MRAESGPYTVGQILKACNGMVLQGDPAAAFRAISTDSRNIKENDLFVPLKGTNYDGHDFMIPALEAGALGSLLHRDVDREILRNLANRVLIQVQDTLLALTSLASAHRYTHTSPLIAVTGSSGKTTVKEMIAAILGRTHRLLASQGNLNNLIGLPMTVLSLSQHHTAAVVEAGINVVGEMKQLARAASPNVAVITSVGPVHLEGLKSTDNVAREKFELVRALRPDGTAVLPAGNIFLEPLIAESPCPVVTFGIDAGDFRAGEINMGAQTRFEMITPQGSREIILQVPGRHNVDNALAAAAACLAVGSLLSDVADGLRQFTTLSWRMEMFPLPGNRTLIKDCYNANPDSMKAALEVLAKTRKGARTLALLGDMMELGPSASQLHEEAGKVAARLGIDRVIFVGRFGESFQLGFQAGGGDGRVIYTVEDKSAALELLKNDLAQFGAILVKGSRAMKMESLADMILEEQ